MILGTRLSHKSGGECLECHSLVYIQEHLGTFFICGDQKANTMPCEGSQVFFAMVFGIFDLKNGGRRTRMFRQAGEFGYLVVDVCVQWLCGCVCVARATFASYMLSKDSKST